MTALSLTTHVLDQSSGRPGSDMKLSLFLLAQPGRSLVCTMRTNADGRTDKPLLAGENAASGVYELVFEAGAYYRASGMELPEPAFLDEVVIRFGMVESGGHYHVPLLLSPYGYSTYRGS